MSGGGGGASGAMPERCQLARAPFDYAQDRPRGSLDASDHAHLRGRARPRKPHEQVSTRETWMCRVVEAQGPLEFRALAAGVRLCEGQAQPFFDLLVRERNPARQVDLLLLEALHGVEDAVFTPFFSA